MDAAASRISLDPVGSKPGASRPRPNLLAARAIRLILRVCNIINGEIRIDTINIDPISHIIKTSVLVEYILCNDVPNVAIWLFFVGTSMNSKRLPRSMYMSAGLFNRFDNSDAS